MLFIMFSTLLRNKCMLTIVNTYRGRSHLSYMLLFMMKRVSLIANAYGALLKRLHTHQSIFGFTNVSQRISGDLSFMRLYGRYATDIDTKSEKTYPRTYLLASFKAILKTA